MLKGLPSSEEISCTVDRHYRTRIFDFPGAKAKQPQPPHLILNSTSVQASIVCELETYFTETRSNHYEVSPSLRHVVKEICSKPDAGGNAASLYIVIEEVDELEPVVMDQECALLDEVIYEDGKRTPLLTGGRDYEKFIMAFKSSDGKWPIIPSNEQTVYMILAAVRASQDAHDEIRKHADSSCLATNDGRFVCVMPEPTASARLSVVSEFDTATIQCKAAKLEDAISRMVGDSGSRHIELLVNALYWDDYKDDDFRRLHYLSLWQSLAETNKRLGYFSPPKTKLKYDKTVLAGKRSLAELTTYRDDIAHWWTGHMDGNYLADMYRTLNELIRRKYF